MNNVNYWRVSDWSGISVPLFHPTSFFWFQWCFWGSILTLNLHGRDTGIRTARKAWGGGGEGRVLTTASIDCIDVNDKNINRERMERNLPKGEAIMGARHDTIWASNNLLTDLFLLFVFFSCCFGMLTLLLLLKFYPKAWCYSFASLHCVVSG